MFITFEGIEGCGKSTQVERLSWLLQEERIPHLVTCEPGGTRLGRLIRRILLDPAHSGMEALAELLLYAADRAQHVVEVIRPALEAGQWVICDRFADATNAYQGYGRGQDLGLIQELNRRASHGLRPQLTLLLDCPVELGLERARRRITATALEGRQDRFECQDQAFHQKVRRGYLALAEQEPARFRVLDASLTPEEVHQEVSRIVRPYIDRES